MPLVPVPKTWVDQDVATAPVLNTELRDMFNFLISPPRVALSRVSALSLPSGSAVAVPWENQFINTFSMWSSGAPTRITIPVPGKYRVSVVGSFSTNQTNIRVIQVRLNGSTPNYKILQAAPVPSPTAETVVSGSLTLPYTFAIGEYFEIQATQSTGSTLSFAGSADAYVTAEWMGA